MMGITWLSSYPKSGNTWLRAVLTRYWLGKGARPFLHRLIGGGTAILRSTFEDLTGLDSDLLSESDILTYRRLAYEQLASESRRSVYLKVHDAFLSCPDGRPLFSQAASHAAIYLVRSPLDVACSFAYHRQQSLDDTIALMGCDSARLDGSERYGPQLPQTLMSWHAHVDSWTAAREFQVVVARYEDLVESPLQEFARILRECGTAPDSARLSAAIAWSRLDRLQALEAADGFPERQRTAPRFFRRGAVGAWKDELSTKQVERLVSDHRATMERWGYHARQ